MNTPTQPVSYLLLALAGPQSPSLESAQHGAPKTSYIRCLNTAGRWAVRGSAQTPLLAWPLSMASEAQDAAERAARAHGRPVEVITLGSSDWAQGRDIQLFSEALESALLGGEAQSAGQARRLQVEVEKLEAFCLVVQAASNAPDQDALSAVSRAAAKALHAKFKGGSVTSAFAWLAGRHGHETLESVLAGKVELSRSLSIQQAVEAVGLAQQAEAIRQSAEAQTIRH